MARKTIEVDRVLATANYYLAAPNTTAENRKGIYALLESILFATEQYRGFGYLPSEVDANGALLPDYDETRRHYYGKS